MRSTRTTSRQWPILANARSPADGTNSVRNRFAHKFVGIRRFRLSGFPIFRLPFYRLSGFPGFRLSGFPAFRLPIFRLLISRHFDLRFYCRGVVAVGVQSRMDRRRYWAFNTACVLSLSGCCCCQGVVAVRVLSLPGFSRCQGVVAARV